MILLSSSARTHDQAPCFNQAVPKCLLRLREALCYIYHPFSSRWSVWHIVAKFQESFVHNLQISRDNIFSGELRWHHISLITWTLILGHPPRCSVGHRQSLLYHLHTGPCDQVLSHRNLSSMMSFLDRGKASYQALLLLSVDYPLHACCIQGNALSGPKSCNLTLNSYHRLSENLRKFNSL